jgi:hypothetical protein
VRHVLVCGVNNFLDAFMPTLPWWFLVLGFLALVTWGVVTWIRLAGALRHRIEAQGKAWREARDVLAEIAIDPDVSAETREKALSAYSVVNKEISTT